MKNKLLATVGAACLALCASASVSYAASLLPGETMGLAALSPLPEGIYALDLESYGGTSTQRVGVNIPIAVWSTPWTFANTRIEFIGAVPFAHLDGAVNHTGLITPLYGAIFAHDFGGGLSAGVLVGLRGQDPDPVLQAATGRSTLQGDFRGGIYYSHDGWNFASTGWITTSFGGNDANNDAIGIDYSLTRSFDKLEVGFVGYTYGDITNGVLSGGRNAQTEIGGMVGYNFGPVIAQAMVTHALYTTINGVQAGSNETRGWLRLIVPLWSPSPVAAAPLKARY